MNLALLKKLIRESVEDYLDRGEKEMHPVKNDDEPDQEGWMAKSAMYHISQRSEKIYEILGDDEQLPGWLQNKIAVVEDNMQTIYDYITYAKMGDQDEDSEDRT